MLGKPCIKGTRITVEFILKTLAEGADFNYLLQGYPHISREDINQALSYAKTILSHQDVDEIYETTS